MPSPFPGMDPYVEASDRWGGFHLCMVTAMRAQLNVGLPQRFVADVGEYVWIQERHARKRRRALAPDVYVAEQVGRGQSATVVAVAAAPRTIELPTVERKKRGYVRIVDRETRLVVTAIELLSPANKAAGDDREAYLRKRKEYIADRVSLVEIDLLRGGQRLPLSDPPPEIGDYYVMRCRAWQHPRADFWTFTVREPIPAVPIPLTEDVEPAPLDLRSCIDRVYDEGRYATELHYEQPLTPRLSKRDEAWVRDLLAARKP